MKLTHQFSQEEVFEILLNHIKKKYYNFDRINLELSDCEFEVVLHSNLDLKEISLIFDSDSVEPVSKIDSRESFRNGGYR